MAKGDDLSPLLQLEGEQAIDFLMRLPPHQLMLLDELKSKFEATDQRFDTLF